MSGDFETELQYRTVQDCYSTAYPRNPEDWSRFRRPGQLKFSRDGRLSFYIHIPFCRHLCKFCEYTRCLVPDETVQLNYLKILHNDIRRFLQEYPDVTLEGFDIGGGTPTALSDENFAYLMRIYKEVMTRVRVSDDFEPSIETSFRTISPAKLRMIGDAGIRRISIGIQSLFFSRVQSAIGWRYPQADEIMARVEEIRSAGQFKINLDFMYGFKFQNGEDSGTCDRIAVERLQPDQVTLYELRTNQLKDYEGCQPQLRKRFYDRWYDTLVSLGYFGHYGRNTFSKEKRDIGVSSYIRHRMLDGGDYKGFGISAQSMSDGNVEYNAGKNAADILSFIPPEGSLDGLSFDATEHYELPTAEKFAKFVCISAYSGGFSWWTVKERFYPDFFERFGPLLDFLTADVSSAARGEIEITDDRIELTRKGFSHYGALFSLFYQPDFITAK